MVQPIFARGAEKNILFTLSMKHVSYFLAYKTITANNQDSCQFSVFLGSTERTDSVPIY